MLLKKNVNFEKEKNEKGNKRTKQKRQKKIDATMTVTFYFLGS